MDGIVAIGFKAELNQTGMYVMKVTPILEIDGVIYEGEPTEQEFMNPEAEVEAHHEEGKGFL